MSLLTALIVKNSHILADLIYSVILKNGLELERLSTPNLDLGEKIRKVVIIK